MSTYPNRLFDPEYVREVGPAKRIPDEVEVSIPVNAIRGCGVLTGSVLTGPKTKLRVRQAKVQLYTWSQVAGILTDWTVLLQEPLERRASGTT